MGITPLGRNWTLFLAISLGTLALTCSVAGRTQDTLSDAQSKVDLKAQQLELKEKQFELAKEYARIAAEYATLREILKHEQDSITASALRSRFEAMKPLIDTLPANWRDIAEGKSEEIKK